MDQPDVIERRISRTLRLIQQFNRRIEQFKQLGAEISVREHSKVRDELLAELQTLVAQATTLQREEELA